MPRAKKPKLDCLGKYEHRPQLQGIALHKRDGHLALYWCDRCGSLRRGEKGSWLSPDFPANAQALELLK